MRYFIDQDGDLRTHNGRMVRWADQPTDYEKEDYFEEPTDYEKEDYFEAFFPKLWREVPNTTALLMYGVNK